MSQSHGIQGGTADKAFQGQCFLWERGASVGRDFDLFNHQGILQAQESATHYRKGKNEKSIVGSPLK